MQEQFKDLVFDFVKQVSSIPKIYGVFMFGSVAKGEADMKSDVDFLVVLDTQQDPNRLKERDEVSRVALDLEKRFNMDIQLVFSNVRFGGLDGQFVEEVLKEGVILFGRVPLVIDEKLGFAPYDLIHYRLTGLSKSDKMKLKRALYGYNTKRCYKGKVYTSHMSGLVSRLDGKRTGIASVLIPHRKSRLVLEALERIGAKVNKLTVWLPEVKSETRFDSKRFGSDIDIFVNVQEESTKVKILERIRDQTVYLPYDGMSENVRGMVVTLLSELRIEIDDEATRKLCLHILSIVSGRRDEVVNAKMKELFLSKIQAIYDNLSIEEKKNAVNIFQRLQSYDPKFINQLVIEAVERWTRSEFENLLDSIEFDRLNEEEVERIRKHLWNWRAQAKRKKEEEKANRIDKILELNVFH